VTLLSLTRYSTATPRCFNAATIWSLSFLLTRGSRAPCTTSNGVLMRSHGIPVKRAHALGVFCGSPTMSKNFGSIGFSTAAWFR